MRAKSLILLFVCLGCGAVAAIGINQAMARRSGQEKPVEMVPVVVALEDIKASEPIHPKMVKIEQWPKDKVPGDAITKMENAIDKVTGTKILKDEPIREGRLTNKIADIQVPKGYRVIAVKVDATSNVGHILRPGSRVDVMVYLRANPQLGVPSTGTFTVLEDVQVFAINNQFNSEVTDGEETIQAKTISLVVLPEQAQKVQLAAKLGEVTMSLRAPGDDLAKKAEPASVEDLVGGAEKTDRADQHANSNAPADKANEVDPALQQALNVPPPAEVHAPVAVLDPSKVLAQGPNPRMIVITGNTGVQVFEFDPKSPVPVDITAGTPAALPAALPATPAAGLPGGPMTPEAPAIDPADQLNSLLNNK